MASITKEIATRARPEAVWDAIRDVGALHTRLVPGFVTATELIPGGRRVTFANGMVVDEPIIAADDDQRRLVWTAVGEGLPFRHYNASVQVFDRNGGSRVVWTADLLPDEAAPTIEAMMDQGMQIMARTLEQQAAERRPVRERPVASDRGK
jgi:carbon monoxide dehydrogenase subunit G